MGRSQTGPPRKPGWLNINRSNKVYRKVTFPTTETMQKFPDVWSFVHQTIAHHVIYIGVCFYSFPTEMSMGLAQVTFE